MLLRIARRKGLWERTPAQEVLDAGFRNARGEPDMRVSVYEVEEARIVQTFAEHCAGASLDPPRAGTVVDLEGLQPRAVEATPGSTGFAFTREAHRELPFEAEGELLTLIVKVLGELTVRAREVDDAQLRAYVAARFDARDPEWTEYASSNPKGEKWKKHRPRRASA